MSDLFDYYDYVPEKLPNTAGGFIDTITGGMLKDIIMNLHVDSDSDSIGDEILKNDHDSAYDTDKLENKADLINSDDEELIDTEIPENKLDLSKLDLIDSDDEELIINQPIKGGGNVLEILVNLIPTVFPKSYM
jgi:hypothetical protein